MVQWTGLLSSVKATGRHASPNTVYNLLVHGKVACPTYCRDRNVLRQLAWNPLSSTMAVDVDSYHHPLRSAMAIDIYTSKYMSQSVYSIDRHSLQYIVSAMSIDRCHHPSIVPRQCHLMWWRQKCVIYRNQQQWVNWMYTGISISRDHRIIDHALIPDDRYNKGASLRAA